MPRKQPFAAARPTPISSGKWGVDTQCIWGMPAGVTVGIAGSTCLYKKAGSTWLSTILMGTVACLMAVAFGGTRFHFLTYFVQ